MAQSYRLKHRECWFFILYVDQTHECISYWMTAFTRLPNPLGAFLQSIEQNTQERLNLVIRPTSSKKWKFLSSTICGQIHKAPALISVPACMVSCKESPPPTRSLLPRVSRQKSRIQITPPPLNQGGPGHWTKNGSKWAENLAISGQNRATSEQDL